MMISVVMITKNEQDAVASVIQNIKKALPCADILIVDSSDDRTPEIARSLDVEVIRQYPPQGYGKAMMLALTQAKGEVVITLDCDNTYPTTSLKEFSDSVIKEGYDLVDGSRLKAKPKAMPWINYFGNILFARIASILFMTPLRDLHSGMRAYKKSLINNLSQCINPKGAALPVELLLRSIRLHKRVKIINIDYFERVGQSTMNPFDSTWWTIKRIVRSRFF